MDKKNCETICEIHERKQFQALSNNPNRCTSGCIPKAFSVVLPSSLCTMALASLTTYRFPSNTPTLIRLPQSAPYVMPAGVRWNQMSDRPIPSQSTKLSGSGCDIKYGSYQRYLNKRKGSKPLRGTPSNPSIYSGCIVCSKVL